MRHQFNLPAVMLWCFSTRFVGSTAASWRWRVSCAGLVLRKRVHHFSKWSFVPTKRITFYIDSANLATFIKDNFYSNKYLFKFSRDFEFKCLLIYFTLSFVTVHKQVWEEYLKRLIYKHVRKVKKFKDFEK